MDAAECLRKVWTRAVNEGVTVVYAAKRAKWESAQYLPNPHSFQFIGGKAVPLRTIEVFRDLVPEPAHLPDLVTRPREDLFSLAHEYGHFRSDVDGHRTPALAAASHLLFDVRDRALTEAEARVIVDEEERAWTNGRRVLAELGFDQLDEYDRQHAAAVQSYRTNIELLAIETAAV